MLNSLTCFTNNTPKLDKLTVQKLLSFATSDRERECIRYAVFKASNITATQARRLYGFENMKDRICNVELVLTETQEKRDAIDEVVKIRKKELQISHGIFPDCDTYDSLRSSSDEDVPVDIVDSDHTLRRHDIVPLEQL